MKCSYHPINLASIGCHSCGRMLCPACDHRIKGLPHCQDCIVAGINLLRQANANGTPPISRNEKYPWLALLLGLIPGLGAAYNGQNVKALVHFILILGLMTFSDFFPWPIEFFFGLAGFGFYCHSLYDTFSCAQRLRNGEDLTSEDEEFKRFLQQHTNLLGITLISIGGLAAINLYLPNLIRFIWPLFPVGIGIYLLRIFQLRRQEPAVKTGFRPQPPSVVQSGFDRPTNKLATNDLVEIKPRFDR